jgi:hypothetical protein
MPYPKKHKRAGAGPTLCQNLQKAWRPYTAGLRKNQVRIPAADAIQPKDSARDSKPRTCITDDIKTPAPDSPADTALRQPGKRLHSLTFVSFEDAG